MLSGLPGAEGAAVDVLVLFGLSVLAGFVGALVGLGGGIFVVPVLVVLFGVDVHLAVAASLVSAVGTSVGAASTYVEEGLTDVKLGMFLETATALGGLVGAIIAVTILSSDGTLLVLAFVPVVLLGLLVMPGLRPVRPNAPAAPDPWAQRLGLGGTYFSVAEQRRLPYEVHGTRPGLLLSGISGVGSGLLGIGGGMFFVPAMHGLMGVPMRVATTTSSFMIGVTAAAGALVYLFAGDVSLPLAMPTLLGVVVGSFVGTSLQPRFTGAALRAIFLALIPVAAAFMLLRGLGVLS